MTPDGKPIWHDRLTFASLRELISASVNLICRRWQQGFGYFGYEMISYMEPARQQSRYISTDTC